MSKAAYSIIKGSAQRCADISRLRSAYDEVWANLKGRIGDEEGVSERLAALIVAVGNRRPEADASEVARIVERPFHPSRDQE